MNNIIAAQETTGVFERKEKKYVLTRDVLESFLNSIHSHLVPDERGITRVSSLYYDTPENTLISRSLEKPVYKEKLRIRAYGDVDENSEVFVELKKKFKGIVYKRRFSCPLSEAEAFMSTAERPPRTIRTSCSQGSLPDTLPSTELTTYSGNKSSEGSQCEGLTAANRSATCGPCKVEKLVGISTELYMERLCVGIGINIFHPEQELQIEGLNHPVYLEDFSNQELTLDFVLKTVLDALNAKLEI